MKMAQEITLEHIFKLTLPSPLQRLHHPIADQQGIRLFVKRDDLIHPDLSGNKYRKLKGHFKHFVFGQYREIVAFGGAFSNLLYSLSFVTRAAGIPATFYLRGDRFDPQNPTLAILHANGAMLQFISRTDYRKKSAKEFQEMLLARHPGAMFIAEGASDPKAIEGSAEILQEAVQQLGRVPEHMIMDMGTGGTIAGVIAHLPPGCFLTGIPVLKGVDWDRTLANIVSNELLNAKKSQLEILSTYHFGGFARFDDQLIQFINQYRKQHDIPLDPIYTGKLAFAVEELLRKHHFSAGADVVWVHSGGLQGIAGFNYRFGDLIDC